MAKPAIDLALLTLDEKLELIGDVWDSLDGAPVEITPQQRAELDRRLAVLDTNGASGSAWSDVEARVRARAR